jgi:hypothetical protein
MSYPFRDQLITAHRHDLYPPEWLDAQVANGLAVPLVGNASAILVGTRIYPSGQRVGVVKAGAGDLAELVNEMAPRAEQWAREHGCTMALLEGRPGWERALKEHGWRVHQVHLIKEL